MQNSKCNPEASGHNLKPRGSVVCLFCILHFAFCILCAPAFAAADKKSERILAAPDLSDNELLKVRELFEQFSAAFRANDAAACLRLIAGSPERQRIRAGLEREFKQSRYLSFEVAEIRPDDKLGDRVHSVDVLLRYELAERGPAPGNTGPHARSPSPPWGEGRVRGGAATLKDSNTYTFVVRKLDDGSFALVSSQFFETLGLRHGLGVVPRAAIVPLALSVFLAFWVWMGLEAFRARPRSHLWRAVVVFVPLLGASAYFLWTYLPARLKRK